MEFKEVKFEIYIPEEYLNALQNKLRESDLCIIGNYDSVMAVTEVTGYWRPLEGATPFEGAIGSISKEKELKIEFRCQTEKTEEALKAIKEIHPYEEPVINIIPLVNF